MKKIAIILVSVLALSMMMAVAPALAARTPKPDQVFVKLVDATTGKGIGKGWVFIYEGIEDGPTSAARTVWVTTKGNGLAVISLNGDTLEGSWSSTYDFTVVYTRDGQVYYRMSGYTFDAGLTANIVIAVP